MRVFLDANILFSAAKSDGAVRALRPGSVETAEQEAAVAAYARRVM